MQFQNKSIEKIPKGRGVLKVKILEAKYEAKLEFPGGTGDAKQKTLRGGSMDIFWNCTMYGNDTSARISVPCPADWYMYCWLDCIHIS